MGERRIIWLVRRWLIDVFWTLWYPWIFLPMNIEWRIIENRVMQVNDSLSPPPVWKMYLCLCNHEEKSLYVYDWYSLIWFAHKYSNFQSHGHKTCPVPQITLLTSIMNYPLCMSHDLATVNRHDHAWTETWAQTSVRCASRYLSGDHDMRINKVIGAATPAGWKVSGQIIQLALPNWMWVSWSSWEGRIGRS